MNNQPLVARFIQGLFLLLVTLGSTHYAMAQKLEGVASFYGDKFDGRPTSTGETFRKAGYSAASLDLPWGTIVEVTNLSNGKTTQVRVNDCGPHAKGRIIDLSRAAAEDLDFVKDGEANVRLRIIKASNSGPTCNRSKWAKKLKAAGKEIPGPPPPWDPTETVAIAPVNEVVPGPSVSPGFPIPQGDIQGLASYYADRFQGRTTSTGEVYDHNKYTAASKAFAYGTRLEVTNIVSGAKTEVTVNDCGPSSPDRILDLSRVAAEQIGILAAGTAMVSIRILEQGTKGPTCNRSEWLKNQKETEANAVALKPGTGGSEPIQVTVPVKSAEEQPENLVGAYTLQVGAFGSRDNAEKLVAELKNNGFSDAYSVTGTKLTKVFTGLAETKEEAKVVEKDLVEAGYAKPKVVSIRVLRSKFETPEVPDAAPATYGNAGGASPEPAKPVQREFAPDEILFGVQVGAYSSKSNADKMMEKLKNLGFDLVYSADVGKTIRVFVGKFYFQSQAAEEKGKLEEAGIEGASVRRVQ
ncbi:septal ring lytic transglycosylase RlpA family protein [Neolewinella aurantiaca]|nr:septal ring lytic transglycosylase RlpA family protein [Neolewinella aurantiaca]